MVGLILRREQGPMTYELTPTNADTFAETGGDGVHFSFLRLEGHDADHAPVVMTVPMAFENANVILGDSLGEFLALGCRCGYFGLEQLAYDRDGTIDEIQRGPVDVGDDARRLLTALASRFGLHPWTDVRGRLNALERQHRGSIRLSDTARQLMREFGGE